MSFQFANNVNVQLNGYRKLGILDNWKTTPDILKGFEVVFRDVDNSRDYISAIESNTEDEIVLSENMIPYPYVKNSTTGPPPPLINTVYEEYNGAVYIFGGTTAQDINTSKIFLPPSISGVSQKIYKFESGVYTEITGYTGSHTFRKLAGSIIIGDNIYIYGGLDSFENSVTSIDVYNITANSFTTINSGYGSNEDRYGHKCVEDNNIMYVFGGHKIDTALSYLNLQYNIGTDTWSTAGNLSVTRHFHTALEYDSKIYVLFGLDGTEFTNEIEIYDIPSLKHTVIKDLPIYHFNSTSYVNQGKINILGGFGVDVLPSRKTSIIDIDTFEITEGLPITKSLADHSSVIIDNEVILFLGLTTTLTGYAPNLFSYNQVLDFPIDTSGAYTLTIDGIEGKVEKFGDWTTGILKNYHNKNQYAILKPFKFYQVK